MSQSDASKHGKHGYFLFGKESTYGTPVAATKDIGLVQNFTPNGNNNLEPLRTIGTIDVQQLWEQQADLTGTLETIFQHGRIFEYITGGTVTHTTTSSDTKHEFALADDLPSMTIEEGFNASDDIEWIWHGVKLSQVTISYTNGAALKVNADWNAEDCDASGTSASSKSISTLAATAPWMGSLSWGTESSETGFAVVESLDFIFSAAEGGEMRQTSATSRIPAASEANGRSMKFNFTVGFKDSTAYHHFLGSSSGVLNDGTEIADRGLVFNANNGVSLGSGRREINIDVSNCKINTTSRPTTLNGFILQSFEGEAETLDDFFTVDNIASGSW